MAKTPGGGARPADGGLGAGAGAGRGRRGQLEELMRADGVNGALEPWDWRYYAAIRQAREHDFDEAALKPYLELDSMLAAAFDVAGRLFGLSFHPIEAELYHPDARAWEVRRGDRHMGVFIGDYFARPSKRSGAWCSSFRGQTQARRRGAADRAQRLQLRQGAGGRAEPADLRRRAYAVPRDGPRAARAAVGRDLRVRLGDQRRAGLRRAAEPALRALAGDAGGAGGACAARGYRRADAART